MGRRNLEKSQTIARLLRGRLNALLCFSLTVCYYLTATVQSADHSQGFKSGAQPNDAFAAITLESLNASSKGNQPYIYPQAPVRVSSQPSSSNAYIPPAPRPHSLPPERDSYALTAEQEAGATAASGAAATPAQEVQGSGELNLVNPAPPTVRRWHSKANAATSYLEGLEAQDVAEILKVSRTGSPIYDGIASVMTVADFGLRHRQQKLREQAEEETDEHQSDLKGVEEMDSNTESQLTGSLKQKKGPAHSKTVPRKQRNNALTLTAADEMSTWKTKRLGSGKSQKRLKEKLAKDKQMAERKSHRVSLRKVVIDQAMDEYFTDRQWFMQQILAPAFANEFAQGLAGQSAQGQRAAQM